MKLLGKLLPSSEISQFIYAIFIMILIPAALTLNTLYLLHNIQRDTDYELNNKALLVESVIAMEISKDFNNPALQSEVKDIITKLPEIKAIEILKVSQLEDITSLATGSPQTESVSDIVLNHLAWGTDQTYSKQINSSIGNGPIERTWLVAGPIHDASGKKEGLINIYLSASQIDAITSRTVTDSLIVLSVTLFGIILLLLNHFRLFEISVLFRRLKDVDKLKDDFVSIASHELRTPITALEGYLSLLVQDPAIKNNLNMRQYITGVVMSIARLKILVEDLLTVSRIEQNRLDLKISHCGIAEVIDDVIELFTPQANEKKLELSYLHPVQNYTVSADRDKLNEIFTNLIGNAIKYTPSGSVGIYHRIDKNNIITYIKDTGVGIAEEDRPRLFQKFSRIANDKTRDISGTGLGLWITKQLVEKMNGKIYMESIENQGTQFVVTFPLSA